MLVRVPDVDVALYFTNLEQLDEAVRWLWVVMGDTDQRLPMSAADADATEDILRRYTPQRRIATSQAQEARARGDRTFTLELEFPDEAGADIERLLQLFHGVDALISEEALAPLAPSEVRAFRQDLLTRLATRLRATT